jgi:uncharacterized protein
MLIGVLSDTHLKYVTPEFRSLVKNRFSGCDIIVHAGDFIDPSVYFYLDKVTAGGLIAVCGDMDPPELRKLLPPRLVFERLDVKFGLIHGWGSPRDLEERILKVFEGDNVGCIIYGHSHNSANHTINNILFFNPGSPTDNYFSKGLSIGYVRIQKDQLIGEVVPV